MDKEILRLVFALSLEFSDKKLSRYHKGMEMRFSSEEESFLADEVKALLEKGVIKISQHISNFPCARIW